MVVRPPGGHRVIFLLSFIFSVSLCLFHTDLSEFNLWNRWILCKHNSWTCLSYTAQVSTVTPPPISAQEPMSVLHFPICHPFHCSVWLCLSSGEAISGKQADSPESRWQIPNTRHLTWVSEDARSDTADLPTQRPVLAAVKQTQCSIREEEGGKGEKEVVNSWDNHVLYSILPYGRSLNERALCLSDFHLVVCWTQALCCISVCFFLF